MKQKSRQHDSDNPNIRNHDRARAIPMMRHEKKQQDVCAIYRRNMTRNISRNLQCNEHSTTSSTPD